MNLKAVEIIKNHAYHPPKDSDQVEKHSSIRSSFAMVALLMESLLPPGRHASLVMTHLEQAEMFANRAVAMESPVSLKEMDDESIRMMFDAVFDLRESDVSRDLMINKLEAAINLA